MPIYLTGQGFTRYFWTKQKKSDSENFSGGASLQHCQPHFFSTEVVRRHPVRITRFIKTQPTILDCFLLLAETPKTVTKKPLCIHRFTEVSGKRFTFFFLI